MVFSSKKRFFRGMFANFYFLSQMYAVCGATAQIACVILAHVASHVTFMVILSLAVPNNTVQSFSAARDSPIHLPVNACL